MLLWTQEIKQGVLPEERGSAEYDGWVYVNLMQAKVTWEEGTFI